MSKDTVDILIDSLATVGVKYVFGVPGAKIDSVFNGLLNHPDIKLIVCRHEQNAAFIAAAVGKMTGIPGVCIATSGPGTSNLVTGLVTANDEGLPVVAIVGDVKRTQSLQRTHQSLRGVELLSCRCRGPGRRDHARCLPRRFKSSSRRHSRQPPHRHHDPR
jgi:thiamine pyrophosphate-dependent acetolactate synthase large subunit-like protein